jgi:hypothetical protein
MILDVYGEDCGSRFFASPVLGGMFSSYRLRSLFFCKYTLATGGARMFSGTRSLYWPEPSAKLSGQLVSYHPQLFLRCKAGPTMARQLGPKSLGNLFTTMPHRNHATRVAPACYRLRARVILRFITAFLGFLIAAISSFWEVSSGSE